MSKLMPAHHREVAVTAHSLRNGYGGTREIPQAGPGLWLIVAAAPSSVDSTRPWPPFVNVIVAPARGPK